MRRVLKHLIRNVSKRNLKFPTLCVHAGTSIDPTTGACVTPIFQSSTFAQTEPGQNYSADCEYTRLRNPTRTALEECLCALEGGTSAIVAGSGLGAATNILTTFLQEGDHVITIDDVYGGIRELFTEILENLGVEVTFMDLSGDDFEEAFQSNTKLVWFESPTNPNLKVTDIERVSEIAHSHGCLVCVDNTFATPYFQSPFELGADVVMHSCTKYLNGHADVLMGTAIVQDEELGEMLWKTHKIIGATSSPFDCYLCIRGIKTLPFRMKQHEKNAFAVAEFLENHPKVEKVFYPGLESHPQHDIAKKQMSGFGGMVTFYIKGGALEAKTFLENLEIFTLAVSLGGVESLAEAPVLMTHQHVPTDVREELGIYDNLIRLSIGVEESSDLIEDLEIALEKV